MWGRIKAMMKWFSRKIMSWKNNERTDGMIGYKDEKSIWKAGQGVKEVTVPHGIWYEVIFAGRH